MCTYGEGAIYMYPASRSFPGGLAAVYPVNIRRILEPFAWAICGLRSNKVVHLLQCRVHRVV